MSQGGVLSVNEMVSILAIGGYLCNILLGLEFSLFELVFFFCIVVMLIFSFFTCNEISMVRADTDSIVPCVS